MDSARVHTPQPVRDKGLQPLPTTRRSTTQSSSSSLTTAPKTHKHTLHTRPPPFPSAPLPFLSPPLHSSPTPARPTQKQQASTRARQPVSTSETVLSAQRCTNTPANSSSLGSAHHSLCSVRCVLGGCACCCCCVCNARRFDQKCSYVSECANRG